MMSVHVVHSQVHDTRYAVDDENRKRLGTQFSSLLNSLVLP